MIFPKCMTGRMPFITCHGYVMPCCWLDIPRYKSSGKIRNNKWEEIDNIFLDPFFNLKNNSYKDIVTSEKWLLSLEKLFLLNYNVCDMKCDFLPLVNGKLDINDEYTNTSILNNTFNKSYDKKIFNKNLIDTWNVDILQIELTNRCSLKCPYCPRLTDKPKKEDLEIDVIRDVLLCKKWRSVNDVGNYGDTIFYNPYHEFLKVLIDSNIELYTFHTAATGKGKKWWDETISLYEKVIASGTKIKIYWGIDGLEDTSSKHRIGQSWDEITYALKRCVEVGCESVWHYIPMSFNEHQIDEAKKLAEDWGCQLKLNLSCRFYKGDPNMPKNPKYHRDFYNVREG